MKQPEIDPQNRFDFVFQRTPVSPETALVLVCIYVINIELHH